MILIAAVLVAIASVVITGGSLARVQRIRFRAPMAIVAALIIQVLIITIFPDLPGLVSKVLHLVSYGLAVSFLWANRRIPWLWMIGVGGLSNLIAIGANGGVMPASKSALESAGAFNGVRVGATKGFANSAYHEGQHLRLLGDIFSVPKSWPLANVFSVGDILIVVGCFLLLHTVCQSRLVPGANRRSEKVDKPARRVRADGELLQHP